VGKTRPTASRFKVKSLPRPCLERGSGLLAGWGADAAFAGSVRKAGLKQTTSLHPEFCWKPPHTVLDTVVAFVSDRGKVQVWGVWSRSSTGPILHGGSLERKYPSVLRRAQGLETISSRSQMG